MKKLFGTLFLLIGLGMIGFGITALVDANSRSNSFEGRLGNSINRVYRERNKEEQLIGAGLIGGGMIFFIVGIVMLVTKTKAQRKKEVELEVLRKVNKTMTNESQTENSSKSIDDKFAQLEKLGKLREKGILSEEEFQQQKKKIID